MKRNRRFRRENDFFAKKRNSAIKRVIIRSDENDRLIALAQYILPFIISLSDPLFPKYTLFSSRKMFHFSRDLQEKPKVAILLFFFFFGICLI